MSRRLMPAFDIKLSLNWPCCDGTVRLCIMQVICRTALRVFGIVSTEVSTSAVHFELRYLSLVEKSLFN